MIQRDLAIVRIHNYINKKISNLVVISDNTVSTLHVINFFVL